MLTFLVKVTLYVFILTQVVQSLGSMLLVAGSVTALEFMSYLKGKDDAINDLVKVKVNTDGN